MTIFVFFFFFQAEDGIRDWSVTGVQTCALPICRGSARRAPTRHVRSPSGSPAAVTFERPAPGADRPRAPIDDRIALTFRPARTYLLLSERGASAPRSS